MAETAVLGVGRNEIHPLLYRVKQVNYPVFVD